MKQEQIQPCDEFRPLETLQMPDRRQLYFAINDNGQMRTRNLADHHCTIAEIAIGVHAPADVRVQFDTAKNLLLHSWFVYRFIPAAELVAYAAVELALRTRFGLVGSPKTGLKDLLNRALSEGLLTDSGFNGSKLSLHEEPASTSDEPDLEAELTALIPSELRTYSKQVAEAIPFFRNILAHGQIMLGSHGYGTLQLCSDIINQLFPAPGASSEEKVKE